VTGVSVKRLAWSDVLLGGVNLPAGRLELTLGLGSGLTTRAGDAPDTVWALTDRGPNLSVEDAVARYGLDHLLSFATVRKAKIMPRPDMAPEILELRIKGDVVELVRRMPLHLASGQSLSGRPIPGEGMEQVFGLDGASIGADALGADPEAIAAMPDGGFWIAEEYGPSLLKVDASGVVTKRWTPAGREAYVSGVGLDVSGALPAIAARRTLNRGFEGVAASTDGLWLYAAFQSTLDGSKGEARNKRFARIWKLDSASGTVVGQHLYPFDAPESFPRDQLEGEDKDDLKICDLVMAGPDTLIVLERMTRTAKLYVVELRDDRCIAAKHLDVATQPALEDMNASELDLCGVTMLEKRLLFSGDDFQEIGPDIEGVALLSANELLLVSDNDFGVDGAKTQFWRVQSDAAFV
jgi:Esterase-like activity of phytase